MTILKNLISKEVYYIGLDVSMKETSICVMDEAGQIVYEGINESDPAKLAENIETLGFNIDKVAIESGSISQWPAAPARSGGCWIP